MKKLLKPLMVGLGCNAVTFPLSVWAAFWLPVRYHGFDHVSTDPDYHAAIAMGTWACFVQAVVYGIVVCLATVALMTRYWYRRTPLDCRNPHLRSDNCCKIASLTMSAVSSKIEAYFAVRSNKSAISL